jgi:hypothetical protein
MPEAIKSNKNNNNNITPMIQREKSVGIDCMMR